MTADVVEFQSVSTGGYQDVAVSVGSARPSFLLQATSYASSTGEQDNVNHVAGGYGVGGIPSQVAVGLHAENGTQQSAHNILLPGIINSYRDITQQIRNTADMILDSDAVDNVWLRHSTNTDNDRYCSLLAIAGVQAQVLRTFCPASTGVVTYPVCGTPVGVIAISGESADTFNNVWGMSDGTNEFCVTGSVEDVSPRNAKRLFSATVFSHIDETSGTIIAAASVDSFAANSLAIDWTTVDTSVAVIFVVLTGASVRVGASSTRTTNGTQSVTGGSFTPEAVITAGCGTTNAQRGSVQDDWRFGLGVSDAVLNRVHGWLLQDGGASNTSRRYKYNNAVAVSSVAGGAVVKANVSALNSDGHTQDYTLTDGTAYEFAWMEIAESAPAAAAGGSINRGIMTGGRM